MNENPKIQSLQYEGGELCDFSTHLIKNKLKKLSTNKNCLQTKGLQNKHFSKRFRLLFPHYISAKLFLGKIAEKSHRKVNRTGMRIILEFELKEKRGERLEYMCGNGKAQEGSQG